MGRLKITLLSLFLISASAWSTDTKPELVSIELKKAWVPVGFDDNDQAQIMVAGIFPNSCYKTGPYTVKQTERGIEVAQLAYLYKAKCIQMAVPFSQVIELGLVPAAKHSLIDAKSGVSLGEISVVEAKDAAVDDYNYAPVSEAIILRDLTSPDPVLHMTGNLPSKSIRIKEIRVTPYADVVVVQPITESIPGLQPIWELIAEVAPRPRFEVKKALKNLPKGVFLLHIRTMNGKAINQLQNFE